MYKARFMMKFGGLVTKSKIWKVECSLDRMEYHWHGGHASVLEPYSLTARGSRSVFIVSSIPV